VNPFGSFKLSSFSVENIDEILSWVKCEKDRILWSGNSFNNGLSRDSFLQHLERNDLLAFQLSDKSKSIQAYGEIVIQSTTLVSLCRIIINPKNRGIGMGKNFCKRLISEISQLNGITQVSLNTLTSNVPAMTCYRSLGFRKKAIRRKSRLIEDCWHDLILMSLNLPNKKNSV